jgi:hypothetical protein
VILLGLIYVIIVLFTPGGLASGWRAVAGRLRGRRGAAEAGDEDGGTAAWVEAASRPPE